MRIGAVVIVIWLIIGAIAAGQRGYFGERFSIQRAIERIADAIVDQRGGGDLAEPHGGERSFCLLADVIVACSANEQIALLELAGKDKRPSQVRRCHEGRDGSTLG